MVNHMPLKHRGILIILGAAHSLNHSLFLILPSLLGTVSKSLNSSFQTLGTLLLAERFWANEMVFIAYGLGAIIFYYLSYRLRIIPRFLSIWGLIGAPLVLINVMLEIFGFKTLQILGVQMGLNEIILGIWLIVKGFYPSANVSGSAETDKT